MTILFALVRATHFASLMTIFGAEALRALLTRLPHPPEDRLPQRMLSWAAVAALVTAILWLLLAVGQMNGNAFASSDPRAIWTVTTGTIFGHVAAARVLLLVLLLALMEVSGARTARIGLSGLTLGAVALTSHAAASGNADFHYLRAANDAVHLLAAGFWIGGLALLVPLVAANRKQLVDLLPVLHLFSFWAAMAVAALIVAGALNAYLILFGVHARWSPSYITILAAKIVLAALMVSFALANRFSLVPGIKSGNTEAEETLMGSMITELVIGFLILLIVGVLGLVPPMQQ